MRIRSGAPSPSLNHDNVPTSSSSSSTTTTTTGSIFSWLRRSWFWYAATFVWLIGQQSWMMSILLSLMDAAVVDDHSAVLRQHETTITTTTTQKSILFSSRNRHLDTKSNPTTTTSAKQSFVTSTLDPTIAYPAFAPEQQQQHSDYAFAFVIGGCDLQSGAYKGYLYTVMIAARLLQRLGSIADVVCLVQLKYYNRNNDTELPHHQVEWLRTLNVHLYYIPKSRTESFYETVLNKFRILALQRYRRVILLDGDVIPVRNMDYLFALSDYDYYFANIIEKKNVTSTTTRLVHSYNRTIAAAAVISSTIPPPPPQLRLRENVVVAGSMEPANGGFFMLAPNPGAYNELQEIVKKRAHRASQQLLLSSSLSSSLQKNETNVVVGVVATKNGTTPNTTPVPLLFDVKEGWGHVIRPPDRWTTRRSNYSGTDWDFLFAYSDQGLLYHWTKYVRKEVSIIFQDYVENWSAGPNGEVTLQETLGDEFFLQSTPGPLRSTKPCEKFMCDFVHFSGRGKPWMFPPISNYMKRPNRESFKSMTHLWWSTLIQLNDSLQMNLDFEDWDLSGTRPDFGFWAKQHDLNLQVYEAAKEQEKTLNQ